jgi:hypothetical protein
VRFEQLRGGFLDATLERVQPLHRSTLRTAIDRRSGRARDGFLFAFDSLAAGTKFAARLEADPDVSEALLDRVVDALVGQPARIGRSRNTEFGRVRIQRAEGSFAQALAALETPSVGPGPLVPILVVSDLALRDPDSASPTLTPSSATFGMGARGSFDWDGECLDRSCLRTRSWSPFHGARRRPDLERQVIVAGSVITVRLQAGATVADLRARLAAGVGDYRAEGLGRVLVAPALLAGERPKRLLSEPGELAVARSTPLPGDALGLWLSRRVERRRLEDLAHGRAMAWAKELRAWKPRLPNAQWGELRRLAAQHPCSDQLLRVLFQPAPQRDERGRTARNAPEAGFVNRGRGALADRWGVKRRGADRLETRAEAFERLVRAARASLPDPWLSRAVERMARELLRPEAQPQPEVRS